MGRYLTLLCLLLTAATAAFAQQPARAGWQLVWSDEFNGTRLDTTKWNLLLREQSKHNELQYYLPDEAYVERGWLRLRSRVRDYGAMHYTSGRIDTSRKFAPTYGRFEIRARMPGGKGLWPAHWLYPQNRDWAMERLMAQAVAAGEERAIPEARPWYSEIDIMEFLGHEPNVVYGTLHYHTFAGEKKSSSGTWRGNVDYTKDFHVYALEWEADSIRWYIDDKRIHATVNGIPHTPHYLILNTAVGGGWPGNPDSTTVFPQYHDIDYVRIYQRRTPSAQPESAAIDPVVEFLISSAATDFHNHREPYPGKLSDVRVGHFVAADGEKHYLLCGRFRPAQQGATAEWIPFVTIKTSGYEQWIGAQAESFCQRSSVVWTTGDLSSKLQARLESLR